MKMRVSLREDRVKIVLRPEEVRNLHQFRARTSFLRVYVEFIGRAAGTVSENQIRGWGPEGTL